MIWRAGDPDGDWLVIRWTYTDREACECAGVCLPELRGELDGLAAGAGYPVYLGEATRHHAAIRATTLARSYTYRSGAD